MNDVDLGISDAEIVEAIRSVAASPAGRMALSVLIFIDCGFDSDQSDARSSAQREVGLRWVRRLQNEAPDDYLKLMAERIERFRELKRREKNGG